MYLLDPVTVPITYPPFLSDFTKQCPPHISCPSTNTLTTTYLVYGREITACLDQHLYALRIAILRRLHQGRDFVLTRGRRVAQQHRRVDSERERERGGWWGG